MYIKIIQITKYIKLNVLLLYFIYISYNFYNVYIFFKTRITIDSGLILPIWFVLELICK